MDRKKVIQRLYFIVFGIPRESETSSEKEENYEVERMEQFLRSPEDVRLAIVGTEHEDESLPIICQLIEFILDELS